MQLDIFGALYDRFGFNGKPCRLIECFGGIGSQSKAMEKMQERNLLQFEHWKLSEWAIPSILAYNEIHRDYLKGYGVDYAKDLTLDEIATYLTDKGISKNYSDPLTKEQLLKTYSEKVIRKIYNSVISERNVLSITNCNYKDLDIKDTNNYNYVLCYSYPCQDVSICGKGKGMQKGSGTRSALLWEIDRILKEIKNNNAELPQVLLMENVPTVLTDNGTNNLQEFLEWQQELENLGYKNYYKVINACDVCDVPQSRNRIFMISVLGDYSYEFPSYKPCNKRLKDIFDKNIDNKWFLKEDKIKSIMSWKAQQKPFERILGANSIAPTLTARGAGEDHSGMILVCEGIDDTVDVYEDFKDRIENNKPLLVGGIGEMKSNNNTQWYQQDRIYSDSAVALTVTTDFQPYYLDRRFGVRKLTPCESYKLLGFTEQDYQRANDVFIECGLNPDKWCFHTAGDSIVVDLLEKLFEQML